MRPLAPISYLFIYILTLGLSFAAPSENISVNDVSVSVADKKIIVDCEVQYGLDEQVKEALRNGIEMMFILEIELKHDNPYWIDQQLSYLQREFKIKYHALSKQYVMTETDSHVERSFPDLYSAFYFQNRLHSAELVSVESLDLDQEYYIRARARLVSEKLPLPLRIKSYVSTSWRASSGWTVWPM